MKKDNKKEINAPKTRNRIKLKPSKFYCRMKDEVKEMMREKAEKRKMNMSEYVEYLIQKDRPK